MGYTTDFEGELRISPVLSNEFVEHFNTVVSRRNNTYNDGDEGSFDQYLSENGYSYGSPSCWCQWTLSNSNGQAWTCLQWDEGEKFYEYTAWLQVVIDFIVKETAHPLDFQSSISWQGEWTQDRGTLAAEMVKNKWKVIVKVTTTAQLNERATGAHYYFSSGFCPVLLDISSAISSPARPSAENSDENSDDNSLPTVYTGIVESKDELIIPDDPYQLPPNPGTAWASFRMGPTEVSKYIRHGGPVSSLLHLCLGVVHSHMTSELVIPEELIYKLKNGGRHCSGCKRIFWGPSRVQFLGQLFIGYGNFSLLGRYCSVRCYEEHPMVGDTSNEVGEV